MSLQVKTLSDTLRTSVQNTDFSKVEAATVEAVNNFDASIKTVLGSSINEIKGGIQALTKEIDDTIEFNQPNQVPTVGRVTQNVPNITDKLIGNVGSAASDISKITGTASAAANGFIQDIVTATSPEAVQNSLQSAIGATTQELTTTLKDLTTTSLQDVVTSAVNIQPFDNFIKNVNIFINQLNNNIQAVSDLFIIDLGEKLSKNYEINVLNLVDRSIPFREIQSTFALVANGNYDKAFNTVEKYIDRPDNYDFIVNNFPRSDWPADVLAANVKINQAQGQFKELDVNVSSYINQFSPGSNGAGINSFRPRSVNSQGSEDPSTWDFSDIESFDELEGMFRAVNRAPGREIAGAIVHWSASFLDQNVGSEWIDDIHRARGFSGCGYHIIIRRDGTMQRGRPLNRSGAHDKNNNATFLGFCFIGGVNEFSSRAVKPFWKYASVESLTPAQFKTYDGLMRTFHKVFPYAQVQGHYATSTEGKVDPGFDVVGYSESKFNHRNSISEDDPRWKSSVPITINDIIATGA